MIIPFLRTPIRGSTLITRATVPVVSRAIVAQTNMSREFVLMHNSPICMRSFASSFPFRAAASTTTDTATKTETKRNVNATKKPTLKKKDAKKKAVGKNTEEPKIYKKDMTPPFKRPLSPWIKFYNEYYAKNKLVDERPNISDYLQKASAEWKQLSDEQKAAYRSTPTEWEEYRKNLEEWKANLSPAVKIAIRKLKKQKRRHGQKAPLSPWFQYIKENFRTTQFPPEATKTVQKLIHLHKIYVSQITETEKQALSERSTKDFEEKLLANA